MKLFITLTALVAVSTAFPATNAPDPDLMKDFQDFVKCVNINGMINDVMQFAQNDPEVQHILEYIDTDAFKDHIRAIDKEPTYLAVLSDLDSIHVPAYQTVNQILEQLGIEPIVPPTMRKLGSSGLRSFQDLIDKIEKDDVDLQCVEDTYNDKMNQEGDTAFKELDAHLHSDDFAALVGAFKNSDAYNQAVEAFHKEGLNLQSVVDLLKKIFHWDW